MAKSANKKNTDIPTVKVNSTEPVVPPIENNSIESTEPVVPVVPPVENNSTEPTEPVVPVVLPVVPPVETVEAKEPSIAAAMQPYIEQYPHNKLFYVCSDGQVFLQSNKQDAVAHQTTLGDVDLLKEFKA